MEKEEAEQIMKLIKVAQKLGREAGEKQYQKLLAEEIINLNSTLRSTVTTLENIETALIRG